MIKKGSGQLMLIYKFQIPQNLQKRQVGSQKFLLIKLCWIYWNIGAKEL
jgi:hypothetical protein